LATRCDTGDKLLRREPDFFSRNHDGRTVRVVGADKIHRVALHALEAHPDVRLYVFHHVADVEIAVGIGQGGGDKQVSLAHKLVYWVRGNGDFMRHNFRSVPRPA
jgi:hypothetical protein